jgi:uncharacterized Zn finger protein (UPF0148 family)
MDVRDEMPVEFPCPACGVPVRTDAEHLKASGQVVCPGCGRPLTAGEGFGPSVGQPQTTSVADPGETTAK